MTALRKIIVGYDGSDRAQDALALGQALAAPTGAALIVACVFPYESPNYTGSHEYALALRREAEAKLVEVLATLPDQRGIEPMTMSSRSPARGLHDLAEREGADLLVIGSTHRGPIGRVMPGSVGERLLPGAPSAVAVAPRGYRQHEGGLQVVGVAFDGSREARAALTQAAQLAQACGATLAIVGVVELSWDSFSELPAPPHETDFVRQRRADLARAIDEAVEENSATMPVEGRVLEGVDVARALAEDAERGIDLVVIGSRGYGPFRRVLLGGVSGALLHRCPCPLLVVPRAGVDAELGGGEALDSELGLAS